MSFFDKHPDLIVRQPDPFNGGPPPGRLAGHFITSNDLFFVRNHGGVPAVDRDAYRLVIDGLVDQPLSLSLSDLRRFPRSTVTATLQCAGNRRQEMMAEKPIPDELPWGTEAVSNAEWSGALLRDVLAAAGLRPEALHAAFTGLDDTERHGHRFNFGGSIPLDKALSGEVLLADTMNGQPLPSVHGAPLRVVVPGYIGARSVKWLSRITLQEKPSDNYFQAKAYRLFPPHFNKDNVDWERGLMLGEAPVSSVILSPQEKATVPAGKVAVRGWSLAGGNRSVFRVDVSADGGGTWTVADFVQGQGAFVWRLWEAVIDLAPGPREIVCRAWDTAAQTQPERAAQVWNFKGYANNAWHRVRVTCV
ncbi:MAG TPA: sulfite oxidase [Thermoanaerobaculia bacterium]|nr:sulfite oxidase [Thermoanaerobaculia bacterium]